MTIELKNRIETEFTTVIPTMAFFQEPTIAQLAELLLESLFDRDASQKVSSINVAGSKKAESDEGSLAKKDVERVSSNFG
jgi:hypothetical protein